MAEKLSYDSRAEAAVGSGTLTKGLVWGLIGGLVATIVIDLITMGVMPLMGSPADTGFAVIGDTAARFFSLIGVAVAGGVPVGALFHFLIGLALGALLGAAVTRIDALRLSTTKKALGLGILYTEVISLPILVLPPIILQWPAAESAFWFGFSFFMHAIWGCVLGLVLRFGLRSVPAASR